MSQRCQSALLDRGGRVSAQIAALSYDLEKAQVIGDHFHPEHQLLFASKGVMKVRTREGIWVVPPLRAVWIPAGMPHSVAAMGAVSLRTLYFLPSLVRTLPPRCFVMNVSLLLRELILHACRFGKLNRKKPTQRHTVAILLDQLEAAQTIPLQLPHPAEARARRVAQRLLADPSDQRRIRELCADCGASKRTIERLFVSETGMTVAQWRRQLRLLHAVESLALGRKVAAVAMEAGYSSTSAFIAMFRRQLGVTPSRYFLRSA